MMESFEDSNCHSMTDSFSLYERYLRSFNVVDSFVEANREPKALNQCEDDPSCDGNSNIDLSVNKHCGIVENGCNQLSFAASNAVKQVSIGLDSDLCLKTDDYNLCASPAASIENSSATAEHSLLTEKSYATDAPVSSEDSKSNCFKHPVFITSLTMENSNNAVDSVPLFRDVRPSESVFKLPIRELSFNGTLKHMQRLKPIVDPLSALTSNAELLDYKLTDPCTGVCNNYIELDTEERNSNGHIEIESDHKNNSSERTDTSNGSSDNNRIERNNESTGDFHYEELNRKNHALIEDGNSKWNEQSYSSLEASFDSGVRSPDMFSDEDEGPTPAMEPFWGFLKDFEAHDKRRVKRLEASLQGVLPPPSVTTLKTDVTEMLKKYYCFLPAFTDEKVAPEVNSTTPTKRVSIVQVPTESSDALPEPLDISLKEIKIEQELISKENTRDLETSVDKCVHIKMCSEIEARETSWPDLMKCRYYGVYYNRSHYCEKFEQLALRYGERFVGAETDTSVNVHSGGLQSPSSASKRKAMRIKMAAAKSPSSRRLSHLARRRHAFCSAATVNEMAHASSARMVLIDRNFFPHRKLVPSERKSPRTRRTPGKKTPTRKTPGKKTPGKTPRSGSSTKKKAMRRLLMDSDHITRSQPREALIKRALFISPESRKPMPQPSSSSVPLQAMKSKRALFGSPVTAETKSSDGTESDQFLKRKRDALDDEPETSRSKIAKSLSFGGDTIGLSHSMVISRRSSEVFASRNPVELNETHKKKLLWAVSEALRVHGWRMCSPGFREKASALARLTRRLLALPPHAARLAAPRASTSETMLRLARQYVFAIIQGRTVDDCFQEEQLKITNEANNKVTGYISASAYQQMRSRPVTGTSASQIKENCNEGSVKQEQARSGSKNILQDKLVNIDSNSNSSSSGFSMMDKTVLFKSNSMPSFEEAAKMRARRQISFDNVEFPKR